jgi:hypothetical protein
MFLLQFLKMADRAKLTDISSVTSKSDFFGGLGAFCPKSVARPFGLHSFSVARSKATLF